ncbi:MAG: glutamate--tRNA ligase [Verrucomicrobiota bacterium]
MSVRVRFAPSPTGNVHIGNIRVALFNWLFARHHGGAFLLRVEDTDRERSTPEAIDNLLEVMRWLQLDYDEPPFFQSEQVEAHLEAARLLQRRGAAYELGEEDGPRAIAFRIPYHTADQPEIRDVGAAEIDVHSDQPVSVSLAGLTFAGVSKKGKPVPQAGCLAGFLDLEVLDADGAVLYRLNDELDDILVGKTAADIPGAAKLRFQRRCVVFEDRIKGELSKPLDSMKDVVIVRSDGSPVFHLANVCDDAAQQVTHIIRGDDHVENTYRHVLLFRALGMTPPTYAHLPMIVNQQGKPYSKRDGDAFAGDFRAKGYLPDALTNYLALLGWAPGDDREKMTREEMIEAFTLDRVQQTAAQMDLRKLENLNGRYIAELDFGTFENLARDAARTLPWYPGDEDPQFRAVARMLQSRTKKLTDVAEWAHFFQELPEYDEKAARKSLGKPEVCAALADLANRLAATEWTAEAIENTVHETTEVHDIKQGKLNQPLRIAVTGSTVGAGVFETLELLGPDRALKRMRYAVTTHGAL